MEKKNNITPFEKDIVKWYSDLVLKSDLVSYAPVKGTMFFKPHGFAIWNNIIKIVNNEFEKLEVEEVQFPLLIPQSFLEKEKKHVEGFAPEVLKVTNAGAKRLAEPLIIRPTSETLFGKYFEENLKSYSQLPVKLQQWVNVLRWENNTRPFLRNSEFFWQEGHTIHATAEEAHEFTKEVFKLYEKIANEILLLPVIAGEKTVSERFAGANNTYTIETILKDGQALQSGTSHYLSDNFSKAFNIKVQNKDNKLFNPYQTSWGISTRLIGAIIMEHSDNKGLILPSKIAPIQIAILTLFGNKNPKVLEVAKELNKKLNFKIKLDNSDRGLGYKSQEWELKGVPIRIEIGPNELDENKVTISLRNFDDKIQYNLNEIDDQFILKLLDKHDKKIYDEAVKIRESKKVEITSVDQIQTIVDNGQYGFAYWIENADAEKQIKTNTGATIRCLIDAEKEGQDIINSKPTKKIAVFSRAY